MDNDIEYVRDTLAKQGKPFLATLMTRSNHYPFNFAAGMTDEEKNRPLQERINVTMGYADRQLVRFIRAVENEEWYKNTYVIVMADHGFPLGENGDSTMNDDGFSNVSWIPFFIHGKGLEAAIDTTPAALSRSSPPQDETHLFANSDLRQENELTGKAQDTEKRLSATLDTLLKISDYSLERGL